ncbi:MAG: FecR domain-containing protein [Azospirillaceae bacterium]|nr:FecR domain-containing protein [Azospirillaceae bacterium]
MTAAPPDTDDRALDQAVDWLIRLAEAPTDATLRARCDQWRTEAPENEAAWHHANRVSGLIGRHGTGQVAPFPPVRQRSRWALPAGAAVAACLVLALLAPTLVRYLAADQRTGVGERRVIALADGSTVTLAPQSAIRIDFSPTGRRVTLLAGEGYFAVAHDPARPFQVVAGGMTTSDIGTAFDVVRQGQGGAVAVREGAVSVRYDGAPDARELHAGDWLAMDGATVADGRRPPETVGGWTRGTLAVIDRPLAEVVAALRPYYSGLILLSDERLAGQSVTGSFDLTDPEGAVRALVRPHGAEVRRITPWLLVISPA